MKIIYGLKARGSDEFRYVGQTVKKATHRFRQHLAAAKCLTNTKPLYEWIRTLRDGELEVITLETMSDEADINAAEISWIAFLKMKNHSLLNLTTGGSGPCGYKKGPEMKESISRHMKAWWSVDREGKAAMIFEKGMETNPDRMKQLTEAYLAWHTNNPGLSSEIAIQRFADDPDLKSRISDGMMDYLAKNPERIQKMKDDYADYARVQLENSNGSRGVTWYKASQVWNARMGNNHLGSFDTKEKARERRIEAEQYILNGGTLEEFLQIIRATRDPSVRNRKKKTESTGVYWCKNSKRWMVTYKKRTLGSFLDQAEAIQRRLDAEKFVKGGGTVDEYKLNFVKSKRGTKQP